MPIFEIAATEGGLPHLRRSRLRLGRGRYLTTTWIGIISFIASAFLSDHADARSLSDVAGRWCSDTNYVFTIGAKEVTSGKLNNGPPGVYKILRFDFKKGDVFMWAYYQDRWARYHFSNFEHGTMRIVGGRFEVFLQRC
jgi:hypothetical protein